jgi:hypothetical protein
LCEGVGVLLLTQLCEGWRFAAHPVVLEDWRFAVHPFVRGLACRSTRPHYPAYSLTITDFVPSSKYQLYSLW